MPVTVEDELEIAKHEVVMWSIVRNLDFFDLGGLDNILINIIEGPCPSCKTLEEENGVYRKVNKKEEKLKKLGEKKDAPKYN